MNIKLNCGGCTVLWESHGELFYARMTIEENMRWLCAHINKVIEPED